MSFPALPGCLPLPTPGEMGAWDAAAIQDFGLRQEVLMESAGRGCFEVLAENFDSLAGLDALVLAGSGNNGGDALVVARWLADAGARVHVAHTGRKKRYRGAAAANLRLAQAMGLDLTYLPGKALADICPAPNIVVDGLLGTGFAGELRPQARAWIEEINDLSATAFVLTVDIPSGLCGLTGRPLPVAVMADWTVTFHAAKLGLLMPGAEEFTGGIVVQPIGIPGFVERSAPPACHLLTEGLAELMPGPAPDLHKGVAGHVLVCGGSPGLTGAPHLAALGALRAGAGLATAACPAGLAAEVKAGAPDIMTLPLGDGAQWSAAQARELAPRLSGFAALALGPGLGRADGALEFLRALADADLPPLVLDADALYWLAEDPALLAPHAARAVLTPHPGELARLMGLSTREVQEDRIAAARAAAGRFGAVTVLKGAGSVVAEPGGRTLLSPFSTPNLAVAGSGDVLAGLTAALLARGLAPVQAACLGVYWHGLAGARLAASHPLRGNLASEIAHQLPQCWEESADA
ncbi:NAD(P)H-hydrate dehydratase [Desulfocurvus sp. DL9XJH121]